MEQLYYYLPYILVLALVACIIAAIAPVAYRVTRDICVNPVTGKFAEKSTMAWGAYLLGMFTCLNDFIHLSIKPLFDFHFTPVPFETKLLLFTASGILAGINVFSKFTSRKTKDGYGNELAPIVTDKPVDVIAPLEPDAIPNSTPESDIECPAAKKARLEIEKNQNVPFVLDNEGENK